MNENQNSTNCFLYKSLRMDGPSSDVPLEFYIKNEGEELNDKILNISQIQDHTEYCAISSFLQATFYKNRKKIKKSNKQIQIQNNSIIQIQHSKNKPLLITKNNTNKDNLIPTIYYDFIPCGTLMDIINFKNTDLEFVKIVKRNAPIIAFYIVEMVEYLIDSCLVHTDLTPETIFFTHDLLPILGGVEYLMINHPDKKNKFNFIDVRYKEMNAYLADEIKNMDRNAINTNSMIHSLLLTLYTLFTLELVNENWPPSKCPDNMDQNIFNCIISPDTNNLIQKLKTSIKQQIEKTTNSKLSIDNDYPDHLTIYGKVDNIIQSLSLHVPISFFIAGKLFLKNNIFNLTRNEAESFLNYAKSIFIHKDLIEKYSIFIPKIDKKLNKLKMIQNIDFMFTNQDNPLTSAINFLALEKINDNENLSFLDNDYTPSLEPVIVGKETVNQTIPESFQNKLLIQNVLFDDDVNYSKEEKINHPKPLCYQSLAHAQKSSSKMALKRTCQKRNINFHGFHKDGTFQTSLRTLADLSPEIGYDISLNIGRGLHSNGPSTLPDAIKNCWEGISGILLEDDPKNPGVKIYRRDPITLPNDFDSF